MAWCPECKAEFPEGLDKCNQCNAEFASELQLHTEDCIEEANNFKVNKEPWLVVNLSAIFPGIYLAFK